ncbi:malonate decarboxylase holo-[acyl-carrier-protein] synthase [Methylobacterium durans]|uniref:Malonate decarboxylase holo-[acyl-carrier-protein] synthase n=1 Tax=Methylobacterium durans TaxID=2202825 RepID=A0A2U8W5B5_9HYPH|nr:malonate decarboxylase holo-[acyl-carrier-protein] synthase [Methylobacterium durans]AWN41249.1 malonate decarboxylase holo-[acyl-carrier-protein] synthase [Methylobacterium durans]
MADAFRRHDLLDVEPGAWEAALASRTDLDGAPQVADWVRRGFPVIVRRRHPGEAAGPVPVGLPLPPADGKRRIGLALPPGSVQARAPVAAARAVAAAPEAWRPVLEDLDGLGRRHGVVPHLFGGLLWQHLTGLAYLSATSDLDLLWPVSGAVPPGLLDGIAAIEAGAPMRLDGEILLPDGSGVNWRELRAAEPGASVLVKGIDRAALRPADAVLAGGAV